MRVTTRSGSIRRRPTGLEFHRVEFENYEPRKPVDGLVACIALHHVAEVAHAVDRFADLLEEGGAVVVVEWAWEWFDEHTARWCFARLSRLAADAEPSWLHRNHEEWLASGLPWETYCRAWATAEGLYEGGQVLAQLEARLDRRAVGYGPYFFPELAETTEADEQAAIDAGQIRAPRIRYAGGLR